MMTMCRLQFRLLLLLACYSGAWAQLSLLGRQAGVGPLSDDGMRPSDTHAVSDGRVKCTHKKLDIAILLDSSESVGIDNFRLVKRAIVDLSARYHVGKDETRIGLIVFHDKSPQNTRVEFYLNEYFDIRRLQKRINDTVYRLDGVTRMDLAFKYADEKMFTMGRGMRKDALQKIFLITDGMQNPSNNPTRMGQSKASPRDGVLDHYAIAKKLREKRGVEIYAVGVGNVDKKELETLTGDKSKVFLKKDFAALASDAFLDKLSQFNCIKLPTRPPKMPLIIYDDVEEPTTLPPRTRKPDNITISCTHKKLDIAFLLDASGSIGEFNFDKMKNFLRELIRKYPIDGHPDDATRVSLVVFHNKLRENTRIEFFLNQYYRFQDIENHIKNVLYKPKGLTRMDLALEFAYTQVFREENGMRPDAIQIIFLVTDGVQNPSLTAARDDQIKAVPEDGVLDHLAFARQLHSDGVEIYAIGIGKTDRNIDYDELFKLTGDKGRIFVKEDFDALNNMKFVNEMAQFNCIPLQPPTTTPPPPPAPLIDCQHKLLDIAILLDRSSSIGNQNFTKMLSFLAKLISEYPISEDDTHLSLTVFSDSAQVSFYLNQYYDKDELLAQIASTDYPGGNTRMDQALYYAAENVFTVEKGMRKNALQKIFLITDGVQNPTTGVMNHYALAQKLRKRGVDIYAIGISKVDIDELKVLTGDPKKVFARENFDALLEPTFIRDMSELSCDRSTPAPKPAPKPDPCRGVARCSSCCSGSDVYNMVFQPNSGPNYIFTGMRMNGFPSGATGKAVLAADPGNNNAVAAFAKTLSRDSRRQLMNLLLSMDRRQRTRRSIDGGNSGGKTADKLRILAGRSGCGEFLNKLSKAASMKKVGDLVQQGKNVTIFCPTDAAMKKIKKNDVDAVLLDHIAVQHGRHGVMFKSLAGGKITLFPTAWKANGVNVLDSITDDTGHRIVIIDDVIRPRVIGVKDFLQRSNDVSKFYNLLESSPLVSLVGTLNIEKLCFAKNICTKVQPPMKKHVDDVIAFGFFTVIVPTDSSMNETQLKEVSTDVEKRREYLRKHIYVGDVRDVNGANKAVGFSVSSNHGMIALNKDGEKDVLVDAENQAFRVVHSHPVHEGFIYIVEKMK